MPVDRTRVFGWFLRVAAVTFLIAPVAGADELGPLATGVAGHAFDHLGNIGDQAKTAAASGATIIYATGFGGWGYGGLPGPDELKSAGAKYAAYVREAKAAGIRLAIGYVCATSIVKLDAFDRNWTPAFRAQFATPPVKWLQVGRDGKPLPSWYGGDYRPACMNNPDWRAYEKAVVRLQIEAGHDGIFFDNPTVHPQGCYCEHCMAKFGRFLAAEGVKIDPPASAADRVDALRQVAASRPKDFMRFRCTIAADFLAEMRTFSRSPNPSAIVTCNNSLNSPEAFFAQCRTYAYNIYAMCRSEDLIVVEDMASQPRVRDDGTATEFGPVYEMIHAIGHGKPLVAVTLANGDYHTPPKLMRLAMAEAAAHDASYLSWPTWPKEQRPRMAAAVRPMADFLRQNAGLLNGTTRRADAVLFLPYRRWAETAECQPLRVARELGRANFPLRVVCEDELGPAVAGADAPRLLLVESPDVLEPAEVQLLDRYRADGGHVVWSGVDRWLAKTRAALATPSVVVRGPPTIRAVVRDQSPGRVIVHVLNLDVRKVSSFEDRANPASDVDLRVRCGASPTSVKALSADTSATTGPVRYTVRKEGGNWVVDLTLNRVDVSTIVVLE